MGKLITDLSFAGSTISVDGAVINDFIDDKNPIEISDAEVANIEWSCNGRMIRTIKPSAVLVSITVIPGSMSDLNLRRIWSKKFCNGGSVSTGAADQIHSCCISVKNANVGSYIFQHGTCISGAPGIGVNGQGTMGGNTYTFAFEKV